MNQNIILIIILIIIIYLLFFTDIKEHGVFDTIAAAANTVANTATAVANAATASTPKIVPVNNPCDSTLKCADDLVCANGVCKKRPLLNKTTGIDYCDPSSQYPNFVRANPSYCDAS